MYREKKMKARQLSCTLTLALVSRNVLTRTRWCPPGPISMSFRWSRYRLPHPAVDVLIIEGLHLERTTTDLRGALCVIVSSVQQA